MEKKCKVYEFPHDRSQIVWLIYINPKCDDVFDYHLSDETGNWVARVYASSLEKLADIIPKAMNLVMNAQKNKHNQPGGQKGASDK